MRGLLFVGSVVLGMMPALRSSAYVTGCGADGLRRSSYTGLPVQLEGELELAGIRRGGWLTRGADAAGERIA
jgi:hypothetical protein